MNSKLYDKEMTNYVDCLTVVSVTFTNNEIIEGVIVEYDHVCMLVENMLNRTLVMRHDVSIINKVKQ